MSIKSRLARLLKLRCPEWQTTKNDVGFPVLCQCELWYLYEGPHQALISNAKAPTTGTLYQWVGQ